MKKNLKKLIVNEQELVGRLYNPFTIPAVKFVSRFNWITPNLLTTISFASVFMAACMLLYHQFIYAAIFLIAAHFLDAMDGKLARLRGISSDFGAWYDKVTDYTGYALVFMAFTFAFNNFWAIISGVFILGFYTLSVIISHGFYSIISKEEKKPKMIKKKKWYMSFFGITLVPVVLIITQLMGRPEFTLYFFAVGYVGYFLVMVFFQYTYLKKHGQKSV